MERTPPTSQHSEDELETYLAIPITHSRQTRHRRYATIETYLCTNAFNILFLTTYSLSIMLMFLWGAHDQFIITRTPTNRWAISIARGFGYTLNLNTALLIILASRFLFTLLRDTPLTIVIPIDKAFPNFHIIVAYVMILSVIGHTIFHIVWIVRSNAWATGLWNINMCVVTGFAIATILLLMLLASLPKVRKNYFTLFYALHNIGALCFFAILLFHGVYNGAPYTYKWLVGPLLLYAIDRLARKFKVSTSNVIVTGRNSVLQDNEVVMMRVPKQFNFRAGQYAEIKVPSISRYEWHPFTIASAPFEETMCFYIKSVGDWTTELRLRFKERLEGTNLIPLEVMIRGPFGAPAQHVRGYQRIVLISGGVGATPFASVCKDLFHHMRVEGPVDNQKVHYSPDSPAVIRAEMDIRNSLSDLYERNMDNSADEEAFTGRASMVSLNYLFTENHEHSEFFSPTSEASEEPFSQKGYLDRLGVSFDAEKKLNATGKTPISVMREARYTRFEGADSTRKLGDDGFGAAADVNFDVVNNVRADLRSPRSARLLIFIHSVMLNMLLSVVMLLRISFVACASIFRSTMFSQYASPSTREIVFASLDVGLGLLMIGVLLSSCTVELLVYRMAFFSRKARVGDVLVLLPLAFLSILYSFRIVLGAGFMFYLPAWAHFLVILPLQMGTLAYRLYRIIGAKVALADFAWEPRLEKLRAVDFLWTVPFENDDMWLRGELESVANGQELRLHRFLTRQEKEASEEGERYRGITTTYGRPDWEGVFTKLAERTPSGGKVGVFFCGPRRMSEEIVSSIMKVQVLSNLRGMYLGTSSNKTLISELEVDNGDVRRLRARGCNVRFVFREENFS